MQAEEDRPTPKAGPATGHQVGQDLSTLSVDELNERIGILQGEIRRLEAAMDAKTDTRAAAEALFRMS
jgi:uncharacterized small protein (DUF1192 family)